jgi:hypothetical protein
MGQEWNWNRTLPDACSGNDDAELPVLLSLLILIYHGSVILNYPK